MVCCGHWTFFERPHGLYTPTHCITAVSSISSSKAVSYS
uniref:Uncharacterized protein n=1 Tax=Anguilla anguilla TaxID=7936 RepID=A0A0E9UKQ9_ANGAN